MCIQFPCIIMQTKRPFFKNNSLTFFKSKCSKKFQMCQTVAKGQGPAYFSNLSAQIQVVNWTQAQNKKPNPVLSPAQTQPIDSITIAPDPPHWVMSLPISDHCLHTCPMISKSRSFQVLPTCSSQIFIFFLERKT